MVYEKKGSQEDWNKEEMAHNNGGKQSSPTWKRNKVKNNRREEHINPPHGEEGHKHKRHEEKNKEEKKDSNFGA